MPTAQFPPRDFVRRLTSPGFSLLGMDGTVSLRRYLCANPDDGGNANALRLMAAVRHVVRGTPDELWINQMGHSEFERLFTGQGKPQNFQTLIRMIWDNRDQLRAYRNHAGKEILAAYFLEPNPIQEMVDDGMLGLDCVGFVGRYLEAAGVLSHYPSWYPRNYLDRFLPITRIEDLDDLCVLVWVSGSHVAIIDEVVDRSGSSERVVTVCESSSGEATGPQTNQRVLLRVTRGGWLDFGGYGRAIGSRRVSEAERAELRREFTRADSTTGYRGGVFFEMANRGTPAVPVGGHVYVGKLPGLQKGWGLRVTTC